MKRALLLICLAVLPASSAVRILVTAVDSKTGEPLTNLELKDFTVYDDKSPRRVDAVAFTRDILDMMMLLDTSIAGPVVQPMAQEFIQQLQPREQMAVVAYHSSADLIQDFTSSREIIQRSLARVKYGNEPHVLDALYAAIDGGFANTTFRRVILLLTSGLEGNSRTNERDVVRLARRNQISIFPVYVSGGARGLFESLARQTGGASFNLRDMKKAGDNAPAPRIFEAARAHYVLTVNGNLDLGERLRVEVKRPEKAQVSALPLE
jgi:VWFA-related protein